MKVTIQLDGSPLGCTSSAKAPNAHRWEFYPFCQRLQTEVLVKHLSSVIWCHYYQHESWKLSWGFCKIHLSGQRMINTIRETNKRNISITLSFVLFCNFFFFFFPAMVSQPLWHSHHFIDSIASKSKVLWYSPIYKGPAHPEKHVAFIWDADWHFNTNNNNYNNNK